MASNVSHTDAPDTGSQKTKVAGLMSKPLKRHDFWYVLDIAWFNQWKDYVGYDSWDTHFIHCESNNPGPVDNAPLLGLNGHLRKRLKHLVDFELIPEEIWQCFVSWFGVKSPQQPLARKVIYATDYTIKDLKVEIYLKSVKLCSKDNRKSPIIQEFSMENTLASLKNKTRDIFQIAVHIPIRLCRKMICSTGFEIYGEDIMFRVQDGTEIFVEAQKPDGIWTDPPNPQSRQLPAASQQLSSAFQTVTPFNTNFPQANNYFSKLKTAPKVAPEKDEDPMLEIITCNICYNIMGLPRVLPCQHSFCNTCVNQLDEYYRGRIKGINCPTCRQFNASRFIKDNFVMKKMIEFHNSKEKQGGSNEDEEEVEFCEKHPKEHLHGRCVPCNIDICLLCKFDDHDTHPSESYKVANGKMLPEVKEKIDLLSQETDDLEKSLKLLENERYEMRNKAEQSKYNFQASVHKTLIHMEQLMEENDKHITMRIKSLKKAVDKRKELVSSANTNINSSKNGKLFKVLENAKKDFTEVGKEVAKEEDFTIGKVILQQECDCKSIVKGRVVTSSDLVKIFLLTGNTD